LPGTNEGFASRSGTPLPVWDGNDAWSYHTDDKHLDPYVVVLVQIKDPKTGLPVDTALCDYPSGRAIDQQYVLKTKGAVDYTQTVWENITETGQWMIRKLVGGQPRCDAGDTVYQGTYNETGNNTGSQLLRISNLNGDGNVLDLNSSTEYTGSLYFIITITGEHRTTVDKPCQEWKPDWDTNPMDVGNSWTMDCNATDTYTEHWDSKGNLQGTFDDSGTYNYLYNVTWTVDTKASQTVMDDTFPEAYKLSAQGTVKWDWNDGAGHTANGQDTVQSSKWYADAGVYWYAGWTISEDNQKFLTWSTYGPPIDWNHAPQLTKAPPSVVDIDVGKAWEFSDYNVKDTDPGACGSDGFVYTVGATYAGKAALQGLRIDRAGVVNYTPKQEDAADGYAVTIKVSDSCPGSAKGIDIPFTLNIKNVNHKPMANTSMMQNLWMYEDNRTITSWSIYKVFSDPDMTKSPLTGKPYDPLERLTYSVHNNGTLWADIDMVTGNVTFTAQDKQFPVNQNFSLIIMATDRLGLKATAGMTVHVMHLDHSPRVLPKIEDRITIDEDGSITKDFKNYFTDYDVDNPNYLTNDLLLYYAWALTNVTVSNKGDFFTMKPWANWSGSEPIHMWASDMWGERVETSITLFVRHINKPPVVYFQTPEARDTIDLDEPLDASTGGGHNLPWNLVLSVTSMDIDNTDLFYNWTVQDVDTGDVYEWAIKANLSMVTFRSSFNGNLKDGHFTGGRSTKEYLVQVTVSDGQFTVKGGTWDIVVHNVDRLPRIKDVVINKNKNGIMTFVMENDFRNYTLGYGGIYQFTANGQISDGDTALDKLVCNWQADQNVVATGKCSEWGAINISTGQGLGSAVARLGPGDHIMNLTVTDDLGAKVEIGILVHVGSPPPTFWDGVMAKAWYILFAAILIITMFLVGFYLAVWNAERAYARRPTKVAVRKGTRPTIPPKAPYLPKGKVPKKVVPKKVEAKEGPEITQVGTLRIKNLQKRSEEEDLPDDWK